MTKKFLVLDIETTGFLKDGGKITEIGITEVDPVAKTTSLIFDQVMNPGLTLEQCQKAWGVTEGYMTAEEIFNASPLTDYLDQVQMIIDAYEGGVTAFNSDFDFTFLESVGIKFPVKLPCLMKSCINICQIPPTQKMLQAGRTHFKSPNAEEAYHFFFPESSYKEIHRGGDDSLHEAEIALKLNELGLLDTAIIAPSASTPKVIPDKKIVASKKASDFISEIDAMVHASNMPVEIGTSVKNKYIKFLQPIYDAVEEANGINFENPSLADVKKAREIRLKLVPNRTAADKFKKQQKAEKALLNKLEDHSYGIVESQSKLIESRLQEVENFEQIQAEKKRLELESVRGELLKEFVENPLQFPIGSMDEQQFNDLLESQKLLAEKRKADKIQADKEQQEKLEKEQKEQAELKAENERLKAAEEKNNARINKLTDLGFAFNGVEFSIELYGATPLVYDFASIKEMADNEFDLALQYSKKQINDAANAKKEAMTKKINEFAEILKENGWFRLSPLIFHLKPKDGEPEFRFDTAALEKMSLADLLKELANIDAIIFKFHADRKVAQEEKVKKDLAASSDKEKLKQFVSSYASTMEFELTSKEGQRVCLDIKDKFEAFKGWAAKQIEKL